MTTNCSICFTIREQLIEAEDQITTINEKINYFEERLNYLRFTSVNRQAFRPYYQSIEIYRKLLSINTTFLTSLETVYDEHLEYHERR